MTVDDITQELVELTVKGNAKLRERQDRRMVIMAEMYRREKAGLPRDGELEKRFRATFQWPSNKADAFIKQIIAYTRENAHDAHAVAHGLTLLLGLQATGRLDDQYKPALEEFVDRLGRLAKDELHRGGWREE